MAKSRFLSILTHRRRSSKRSSSSEKDIASITLEASDSPDMIRSQEELLNLLNNFPESESDRKVGISSKKSLVVSFLVSSSPEKPGKGGKTEEQGKEATEVNENKACRISRSSFGTGRAGVLLNFHVPVPSRDNRRSPVVREIPCTTLAGIEKREIEHRKSRWWSALLRRKQDHDEQLPLEAVPVPVPQLTYRMPESL